MQTTLAVPYTDTAPADLRFALDRPVLPALAVLDVPATVSIPALQLRLLGASHQAVLAAPGGTLVETLACLPGETEQSLPTRYDAVVAGLAYQFTLEILRTAGADEFAREVASVRKRADRARYGLTGVFPGDDDAVTALLAEPAVGHVAWTTWHSYPGTGDLVRTHSTVRSVGPSPTGSRGPRQ